jgi:hypothetical protein
MPVCPNCDNVVDDGVSICDRCDHILDDAFLAEVAEDADAAAAEDDAPAENLEGSTRLAEVPVKREPKKATPSRVAPRPPPPDDPELRTDPPEEAVPRPRSNDEWDSAVGSRSMDATSELLTDTWQQFLSFPFEERLTIGAAFGLFIATILPWRDTMDFGQEIGVFADAWPAMLVGLGMIILVYLRQTRIQGAWAGRVLQLQMLISVATLGMCIFRIFADTDKTIIKQLRGPPIIRSSPSFGVYLAVIACVVIGVGSFLRWKNWRQEEHAAIYG